MFGRTAMIQAGEAVKVLSRRAGMNPSSPKKDIWSRGTVLSVLIADGVSTPVYKVGYVESLSYEEGEFEIHEVKRYQKQSDDEFNVNFERDLPIGLELANGALNKLFLDIEVVNRRDADNVLEGYKGRVTLAPVQYDAQKRIGLIEKTGYSVTFWTVGFNQTGFEYVGTTVGTYPTIQKAVRAMVQTIFRLKSEDYWRDSAIFK